MPLSRFIPYFFFVFILSDPILSYTATEPTSKQELWNDPRIPVGVTHIDLSKPATTPKVESESVSLARFVTDARQELRGTCRPGFTVASASCDLRPHAFGGSFDMGADLNPMQTKVTVNQPNQSQADAKCQAVLVRPDQVVQLNLEMKCVARRE